MSIASLAGPGFFAPLQGLWQLFKSEARQPERVALRSPRWALPQPRQAAVSSPSASVAQSRPAGDAAGRRPLRVRRVVESGQSAAHGGRMVISGCMADVCAELDRLAAGEVTLH